MKRTICTRILVALLAVMMLVSVLPMTAMADDTKVLESKDLEAFDKGDKAQGDTTVVADYFTINWSEKSKVDGTSDKEWSDGYAIGTDKVNRINFGGKTDFKKGGIHSIKFTTGAAATVKIWWVSGGEGRQMAIYDNAGEILSETSVTAESNTPVLSELTIAAAGTYYLGMPEGNNYILKVEVTEKAAGSGDTTPPATGGEVTPPAPTGDNSAIFAMMAMMVVSLAAVFVLGKKQAR